MEGNIWAGFGWLIFEAGVALALLIGIVVWTMRK
jgi:hypothetical protein